MSSLETSKYTFPVFAIEEAVCTDTSLISVGLDVVTCGQTKAESEEMSKGEHVGVFWRIKFVS